MIAREYTKRIEVYDIVPTPDGFGGYIATPVLLFSSWAKLETNGVGYKAKDFGLQEFNDPVLFRVRFRNDYPYTGRTMSLKYKGNSYTILGIRNVDEKYIEMDIFCSKEDK